MCHFPLNAFPTKLREVILDIEKKTQAPIPLIASTVISTISLSCQNLIDVNVEGVFKSPVSLFLFVIANSGERKTTVDKLVMNPIYEYDENSLRKLEEFKTVHEIELKVWQEKEKIILGQVRKKTVKGLNTEVELQMLKALQIEKPTLPKFPRYIYNNTTPAALQSAMYNYSSSIGLIADEGGNILDRQVINDLSFINSMWDGGVFQVDRKTTQSFILDNGRVTLSIMVQKKPFDLYLNRQGKKARGSGFFARCLPVYIDENLTTQGERFIKPHTTELENLNYFHQRINEFLTKNDTNEGAGVRVCLSLDSPAQYEWEQIYNEIEYRIHPDGEYANMNDFGSKLPNNVARLSALLSYFTEGDCVIKKEYVKSAWLLCEWYMKQAINLFSHEDGYHEALLLSWLNREYSRKDRGWIRFNEIRQRGPSSLRKGKLLERVISNLERVKAIEIERTYKGARLVCEGPKFEVNEFVNNPVFSFY
ncbi:TPA: YfjI family protein [Providencia alcalifaciens]